MKPRLLLTLACLHLFAFWSSAAEPLRVFIRSGPKSHGPGAHDHPSFLRDWVPLLNERGAKASGADHFPTAAELEQTDVLIIHTDGGGDFKPEEKPLIEAFTKRGGGLVVIHAGTVANTPAGTDYYKALIGGSWRKGETKFLEGPMNLYFTDRDNAITKDCSNFEMEDEIYYDMDLSPDIHILGAAYTPKPVASDPKKAKKAAEVTGGGKVVSVYDIQPQIWTYSKDNYRAFVSIPGHNYSNFSRPNFRAVLLRGIAWAGKRANVDELCKPDELGDNLRYVEGGPTRPEKAVEKFDLHPEFNISLVASEPLINKAMNVDWDEKGRLWVVETPEYPNGRRLQNTDPWKDAGSLYPGKTDREPQDKISWLEDTDGDGVMDKKHVFADHLELCTSFCFYKNGVIACAAPDIWYLEDTTGKGVCDKRTKLYTGLGTRDTHAVINNLRWGMDGWIYATHGYSAGHVTSQDSSKDFGVDGSGVVRFKPDGSAFEMYSSKGGNCWGLDMTWDGQCFWTQPTSGTVFFHVVLPEYVLAKGKIPGTTSWNGLITNQKTYPLMKWEQQAYVQIDQVGNYTAAAGCAIYEGGAWPEKWNYSYFTGEPTLNIVSQYFVKKDGVTYSVEKEKGREETEFLRSKDMWFRPIEERVGPDGALYVVDFYNQAVIHNDTRGPLHGPANAAVRPDRDHYFGRIWKVQNKNAKKLDVPVLDRHNSKSLLDVINTSPNAHVKKLALHLIGEASGVYGKDSAGLPNVGNMPSVGSEALRSYEAADELQSTGPNALAHIIDKFVTAREDWTRSAIIAAASDKATDYLKECLGRRDAARLDSFVLALLPRALEQGPAPLVEACASADAGANALKVIIMDFMTANNTKLGLQSPPVVKALRTLLQSPETALAAFRLAKNWEGDDALVGNLSVMQEGLETELKDPKTGDKRHLDICKTLGSSPAVVKYIKASLRDPAASAELKAGLIAILGEDRDPRLPGLVQVLGDLNPELQSKAFDSIVKRPEATTELLALIGAGTFNPKDLGPANIARLRTHPNKDVAKRANAMLDKLNPGAKEKNALIAQLTPEVEKQGDPVKGHVIFTAACSICHQIGTEGKLVGPPLTGMGAHGPGELIISVIDPNREVDPSFWAWNITKNNGEAMAGVIVAENQASITLRNQTGEFEIKKDDIKTRENTHRSLMPEGFEALGAENLRDVLAYICSSETKFRIINLAEAYTADTRHGLFKSEDAVNDTVHLTKFGNVTVDGVPFTIMDPAKSATGSNVVVLKGGGDKTFSGTLPQKVEVSAHVEAKRLQLLSGIAGWGFPATKDERPALKLTLAHEGGATEVIELHNGIEFSDYNRVIDVPGSALAEGTVKRGQLRLISVDVAKPGPITKITLESYNNGVVPVIVAITADMAGAGPKPAKGEAPAKPAAGMDKPKEAAATPAGTPKEGGKGDGPLAPVTAVQWEPNKLKVLVIGGGSSHNFAKFFGGTDVDTLKAAGCSVHYTEDRDQAAAELANADVAVISVNRQFFDTPAYRKALFDRIAAGKGVIMLHPGTWYGYGKWPELNAQIVGGGAHSHDKLGPFTVTVKEAAHPIMKGVPGSFEVVDELYHVNGEEPIPAGTAPIEILAETTPSLRYHKTHPSVWITKNDKARIVGMALGHDEKVHDLPAFRTILVNAVKWVGEKE